AKHGIRDIFGNPLEGDSGVPGSDYKVVLGKPAAPDGSDTTTQLPPSVTSGITGNPGPYVAFPEYTPVRTPPEGASPSDKAATRVVRLYDYRDAHRVAQIVTRNVKSYNYVAVAVRRRLADRARDVANQLTDERRAQETKAIQAAQDARAVEKDLARA